MFHLLRENYLQNHRQQNFYDPNVKFWFSGKGISDVLAYNDTYLKEHYGEAHAKAYGGKHPLYFRVSDEQTTQALNDFISQQWNRGNLNTLARLTVEEDLVTYQSVRMYQQFFADNPSVKWVGDVQVNQGRVDEKYFTQVGKGRKNTQFYKVWDDNAEWGKAFSYADVYSDSMRDFKGFRKQVIDLMKIQAANKEKVQEEANAKNQESIRKSLKKFFDDKNEDLSWKAQVLLACVWTGGTTGISNTGYAPYVVNGFGQLVQHPDQGFDSNTVRNVGVDALPLAPQNVKDEAKVLLAARKQKAEMDCLKQKQELDRDLIANRNAIDLLMAKL